MNKTRINYFILQVILTYFIVQLIYFPVFDPVWLFTWTIFICTTSTIIGELIRYFQDRPKVITLKNYSYEDAKKSISELLEDADDGLYYYQIADKLYMDLELVVNVTRELEKEGKIE